MTIAKMDDQRSDEAQTLSRAQAVEYLRDRWGLSYAPRTLVIYAMRGTGPEYYRAGARCAYKRQALDEWAMSRVTGPGTKASELKPLNECSGVNA